MSGRNVVRGIATSALVLTLIGGAGSILAAPAWAAEYGNKTNNCYGIFWDRDWNQECGSGGAAANGTYKSTADCSLSDDKDVEKHRLQGSTASYDGEDCLVDVWMVTTWYRG